MLSIWISYGSNFNFALASSLILCVFLSLCLFFKLCYTKKHKNNNKCFWILGAWHKRETKVNLDNKVNLIFQCYLILTINKICYLNLSPPLFWMLCAKNKQTNKQTRKHSVTTVLYCGQLSQNTRYIMISFTNVAKACHCVSIN